MNTTFVHLHLHTEYSLIDSVVRIPALMERAAGLDMPAIALTDAGNLFALVKFYREAEKWGIKPIIGADINLQSEGSQGPEQLTVLVSSRDGYRNLCNILTKSYQEGQSAGRPLVHPDWLADGLDGLLAMAGRNSNVGRAMGTDQQLRGRAAIDQLQAWFPAGVYLEVTRTQRAGEERFNQYAIELSVATGVPAVATNDVRFLEPGDYEAHEARVAIHQGYRLNGDNRARQFYSSEQYLKSAEEMSTLFADIPDLVEATADLAEKATYELVLGRTVLPAFPASNGQSETEYLKQRAREGLNQRKASPAFEGAAPQENYDRRLQSELDVIVQMGFPGYFLIVADFIKWARDQQIPVGPGRGSGAGSLVAYALGITDLDPLRYELLFERFLNPERVSMPDFDIDFCMEGRDRVIDYVAQRYGRDRVAQIITYGSMAARAVVRDVGRVLGHPYGFVDKIAKLIPNDIGMTLSTALQQSQEMRMRYEQEEDVRSLINLAQKLEGMARNAGKHAGGVVIAPGPLIDYTPLFAESNGASPVTQLDKDDVEAVGLVKFDFLGLRTLTILDKAVLSVNKARETRVEPPMRLENVELNDPKVYELLKSRETTGVFQLESRGMKELIGKLQPDCFDDIVALVALFRPGPLQSGMVDDFIARKHGKSKVQYPHPLLEPVLKSTHGVILYQEQVMQIAQVLAGYSLGQADLLRRAMGKKKLEEMARQRDVFMKGAAKNEIPTKLATHVFDLMEKFAGYGFNKSHSVAYALLAYQTAWMKVHYPANYMASVLSADMDHTDKIVRIIDECRRMGLEICPPQVNYSDHMFTVEGANRIRYGLGAVKGIGKAAVESLVMRRQEKGLFTDLDDLTRKNDLTVVTRRTFEALIESGACDGLAPNRATMMSSLQSSLAKAEQGQRAGLSGQKDMFGESTFAHEAGQAVNEGVATWSSQERLAREKRTLGLYLSGHPMEPYMKSLDQLGAIKLGELQTDISGQEAHMARRTVRVVGQIMELRRIGRRTIALLDDSTGRIEASFFNETAERDRQTLNIDALALIEGRLIFDDYVDRWRINVVSATPLEELVIKLAECVWIDYRPTTKEPEEFVRQLKTVLHDHVGTSQVAIRYHGGRASGCFRLGPEWRLHASNEALDAIAHLSGVSGVDVRYARYDAKSEALVS